MLGQISFKTKLELAARGDDVPLEVFLLMVDHVNLAIKRVGSSSLFVIILFSLWKLVDSQYVSQVGMMSISLSSPYIIKNMIIVLMGCYSYRMISNINYYLAGQAYANVYMHKALPKEFNASGAAGFLSSPELINLIAVPTIAGENNVVSQFSIPQYFAMIIVLASPGALISYSVSASCIEYIVASGGLLSFVQNYTMFIVFALFSLAVSIYAYSHLVLFYMWTMADAPAAE